MTIMQQYEYTLTSLVYFIITLFSCVLFFIDSPLRSFIWNYPPSILPTFILIVLNIFGIVSALKGGKLKEAEGLTAPLVLLQVGILILTVLLYLYSMLVWGLCGTGPC